MNSEQSYKLILLSMASIAGMRFKLLLPMVVILGSIMIIDIILGIRASTYEKKNGIRDIEISSETMLERIIIKVSQLLLIVVGLLLDIAIYYFANLVGTSINIHPIFAIVITVSLLGKELMSIVENYTRCGYEPPNWLGALGNILKESGDKKGERYVKQIEREINKDE